MNVLIDKKIADKMTRHAEEAYPDECCGFFFGEEDGNRKIICARRVTNANENNRQRRFEIAPDDYQQAEKFALENGLDFLGVYHSHPNHPAEPSEHDRKVAMPYFSYIIISVQDGQAAEIRSWQLNEDRKFEEESVKINKLPIQNEINE